MEKIKVKGYEVVTSMFEDVTIPEAIEELKALEKRYGADLIELGLEYSYEYTDVVVRFMRLETDKEFKDRFRKQEAAKAKSLKKEENELAEYRRLKEKFKRRYESLVDEFGELTDVDNSDTLLNNWRWFQVATMALLYEYKEGSDE